MVSSVSSTTSVADNTAADAMKKSLGLNKDDFLKLFISELKYQDPLKPQDPTAMLQQLSQLSLVEQAYNNNTALQNLLTAQNNSMTMNSVSFIGKDVKASGNSIAFDGANPATLQSNFPSSVESATVTVSDGSGRTVAIASLGALKAGDVSFNWDGRDGNGNLLPAGEYTFTVTGKTASGTDIAATTYTTGRIDGVNIVNGAPMLAIGPVSIAMSDVISVKGV